MRWWKIIVGLLALLPLIRLVDEGVSSILIFTIFAIVLLWENLQKAAASISLPLPVLFGIYSFLFSGLTQLFVQLEGFETSFSANPIIHFFQALVIYLCVMTVWYILLRKYDIDAGRVFLMTGLWGVIFERNFAVLLTLNPLMYLFVFLVYGSFAAIPVLLTVGRFPQSRENMTLKQTLLIFIWLSISLAVSIVIMAILGFFGFK